MALKDEWKDTGKGLGHAFAGLGKNIGRSVSDGIDVATDDDGIKDEDGKNRTVFNDGSWRQTGKDLGGAFAGLGKSILRSARTGVDKLDDVTDKDK